MNHILEKKLDDLELEFMQQVGPGQFNYKRFADYLIEEEPDLASRLVEYFLTRRSVVQAIAGGRRLEAK